MASSVGRRTHALTIAPAPFWYSQFDASPPTIAVAVSRSRLAAALCALSALLAAGGGAWEILRFGRHADNSAARLEAEVLAQIATRSALLDSLAHRAASWGGLVAEALDERRTTRELFAQLDSIQQASQTPVSATIWVPDPREGSYTLLAWSAGPAEDLEADRLTGPPGLFVTPGNAGLRLVYALPLLHEGRPVAVIAVDTILSPAAHVGMPPRTFPLATRYGPVVLSLPPEGAFGSADAHSFVVRGSGGAPLLAAQFDPGELSAVRRQFRWRVVGAALVPLLVLCLLLVGPLLDRRRALRAFWPWVGLSVLASGVLLGVGLAVSLLGDRVGLGRAWLLAVQALVALGVVVALPASAFWRRGRRLLARRFVVRFVLEQLFGGAVILATVAVSVWLSSHITSDTVVRWQLPLVPASGEALAELGTLLIVQIAVFWAGASALAIVARRWRLTLTSGRGWTAALLWGGVLVVGVSRLPAAWETTALPGVALMLLALIGVRVRGWYRHTSEVLRLLLAFAAFLLPTVLAYPLANAAADGAIRQIIKGDYAPATAQVREPEALLNALTEATREIDAIGGLASILTTATPGAPVSSQAAFYVWGQTNLSQHRLTSEVELYGPDRSMISHFALNFAEFESRALAGKEVWSGTNCSWEEVPDVARFGSTERPMVHASRAVCDPSGRVLGAIVVNVVPDYRALPFAVSASPYYEVLGRRTDAVTGSLVADLEVVVYGWSFQPIFESGRQVWPISEDIDRRLSDTRTPFWTRIEVGGRFYEVYFLSDRSGVYALGYPSPTTAQHLVRISEIAALLAVMLVLFLAGNTVFSALARREETSLRRLIRDIRTSFYRKLFLFFVLAAVGPVVLFALAFGSYMAAKFRADVESEAASVVTSARRVYEELNAAARRPDQPGFEPSDDVMVFIRQVIDQDVNLFQGARLLATSQRDLFDSGLLPTRTPAAAYRDIVLTRLPLHLGTDRIGAFEYFVAAAPVVGAGRETVLSVPLVLRQQEIERQINDLNRGVLGGVVVVVLFAAALGASVAGRVSDPVARLSRATRLIAAGRLDVRLVADTADELGRLVDDFNGMAQTLVSQRAELARTNQIKAWAEMSRQVAHEIKNPLTPIQLAAEHLQRVHQDRQQPLGPIFDQCLTTILQQVRLLRQIASEFSTFASHPTPRATTVAVADLLEGVVEPYRSASPVGVTIELSLPATAATTWVDRTLISRALTNLLENALQAMPSGGRLRVAASRRGEVVEIEIIDSGVGMDDEEVRRAFEPYFSTKTTGSGLGLANAKRNIELCGGAIALSSQPGRGTTVTVSLPVQAPPGASASV